MNKHKNNSSFAILRTIGHVALVLTVMLAVVKSALAQEESDNSRQWWEYNEESVEVIDHTIWNRVLKTYVETDERGRNFFNYAAVSPDDRAALKHYLEILSTVQVQTLNKNEQLAFWINLYNALITDIILEAYPVNTILDIGGNLFSRGPWKDKHFLLAGAHLSLNDIRHNVLPEVIDDVRVIYALSCGAVGCPNIGSKAVWGKHVDGYLESATFAFINGPNAILEFDDSNIQISKLYHWNKMAFEKANINIIEHLKSYAMGTLVDKLENSWYIGSYAFNWHVNEVETTK